MVSGKIYILTCKTTDKCYVGSTTYPYLSQRFNTHRNDFKGGIKDYEGLFSYDEDGTLIEPQIDLLEIVEFDNKEDLTKREQEWIDIHQDLCINKKRAYVDPQVKKQSYKESVKKYHTSPKGKFSMRKANLRQSIRRIKEEMLNENNLIAFEKNQIDEEMNKYMELCEEGIDSDYKNMYCHILDRQSLIERRTKKNNKKLITIEKYLKELSDLCPDDPLIKNQK